MKTVQDLTVKVTYRVGLGQVKMPTQVYEQLILASTSFTEIDPTRMIKDYEEASEWLSTNIKEADCMDWTVEIEDISYDD